MPRSWGLPRVAVALAIAFAASGGAAACKSSGVALSVDLRTDYLAGREFGSVVTEVTPEGGSAQQSALPVQAPGPDFLEGSRIADFADLAEGALSVKVRIVSPTGATLVERLARVSVHGDYALTVVVSRSCAGVECPVPDGDPKLSTCDRGQCVSPDCTPQNTGACGSAQCAYDADCHAKVDCIAGRCIAGTCLFVPDDAKCGGTVCDAKTGCGLFPTCSPTSTTEVSCADGVDDDCDGLVDCEDTDCSGKPCGDGCTEGGVCSGSVCTGGKPRSCDDGNPCTDDACVAKGGGCSHTPNTASCDDGVFCNGADTCAGGTCSVHAGNPCTKPCDEAGKKCAGCAVDADCGPVTYGTTSCPWPNVCATSVTGSRAVHTPKCVSGSCTVVDSTQSQTCTRSVSNGLSCGSNSYCCSGSCVAKNDPNHCSSCGVKCGSGSSCGSIGGGNYSCTCSSNAQCVTAGFGSGATCWSPSGQMYCNCQCTTAGCCSGGGSCSKPSGINYCHY
jgi:hypothetical protein